MEFIVMAVLESRCAMGEEWWGNTVMVSVVVVMEWKYRKLGNAGSFPRLSWGIPSELSE